jgi:chromatin segregation and condensation protein Rec8/ScpA/Scc1 (kleisin family)
MSKIHTYNELTLRINELTGLKDAQEIALKNDFKELYKKLQPKNILKETVKDLAHDEEFRGDSFKAIKSVATDFVVGRLFNKNSSVKGFIATMLVEKLVTPLIANNKNKIVDFITNLVSKYSNKKED